MDINFIKNEDGVIFYDFTQICKIQKKYKTNTSQEARKLPLEYVYKTGTGRNGRTFVSKEGLFLWYKTKRDINNELKNSLDKIFDISESNSCNSFESFFINMVIEFLKETKEGFIFEKQYNINGYTVDLLVNKKMIIEFNEWEHKYKTEADNERENNLKDLGYIVLNIDASCNYGKSLGIVFKNVLINNI